MSKDRYFSTNVAEAIGVHEIGHLIAKQYGEIGLDIAQKARYNISGKSLSYSQVLDYLEENISFYSTKKYYKVTSNRFKPTHFHEVIPEVLGKHFTNPDEFTTEFFRLLKEVCGV